MSDGFYKDLTNISNQVDPTLIPGVDPAFGTGSITDPIVSALLNGQTAYEPVFEEFLRSRSANPNPIWLPDSARPMQSTVGGFVNDWLNYLKFFIKQEPDLLARAGTFSQPPPPSLPALTPADETNIETSATTAFATQFKAVLDIPGDWTGLDTSAPEVSHLLDQTFAAFVRFPDNTKSLTPASLMNDWKTFLTVTTVLHASIAGTAPYDASGTMASYEQVIQGFLGGVSTGGPLTSTQITQALQALISSDTANSAGEFIPSQQISAYMDRLRNLFDHQQVVSLTTNEIARRSIMIVVFEILRIVMDRLQETVSVQSQRLLYLGKLQESYSNLINRVPFYQEHPPALVGNIDTGPINRQVDGNIRQGTMAFQTSDTLTQNQGNNPNGIPALTRSVQYYNPGDAQVLGYGLETDSSGNFLKDAQGNLIYTPTQATTNQQNVLTVAGTGYNNNQGPSPNTTGLDSSGNPVSASTILNYRLQYLVGSTETNLDPNHVNDFTANQWKNTTNSWESYPNGPWVMPQPTLSTDARNTIAAAQTTAGGKPADNNNLSASWLNQKGFAGISLDEIFTAFKNNPSMYKIQVPGSQYDASGIYANATDKSARDVPLNPFSSLNGVVLPGVWWFVQQPFDGGTTWGDTGAQADVRNNTLNKLADNWIETLRGYRDLAKDQSKDAQTNVTATRDAINQQANLMSSIVQSLQGIIQAIFKA